MTITKKQNGTALEIALEGRLDTMTAPELEAELERCLDGVTDLTMNLEKLDYVSSAGLRVLLIAYKRLRGAGSMKLTNANEIVMEVLEATGLSEILTIA